ncbi:type 1 glutamine amidotransferase domain-containing protein [Streptomyces acidiscabies]|uniref:Type 1 glutamine amidotransferase domain-containing protein n=1 Tax=Streptomyces acidiscabies TaxID=42234 RepID=A0AAP6BDQ3_9ACTN|nr:type 1 glutamine amidotransferase domain-containing protein [Streptomyces acidiscabies]MBP5941749.1 type 1 glutamine amidotransferase domain-containing protein [Streptomyces sp. LBUM 1476]MBZ3913167.1 type 1 glutamine amidotransferase domain-containing protein [Streptomyces acidiscabies]MDX2962862.1 type 1 glutamine amidotransferase domain-containing protein [Streptomyces acidiscabies]MDX3021373.1 type 1 glutamine amidotransferase domain-containing protein [Streptomyces acidiscabies]MDX3790
MAKILFLMTAADQWTLADGTTHPTGFWAEEAVVPYEAFQAAGHEVTVATPGGAVSPVDRNSLDSDEIKEGLEKATGLREPIALTDVRLEDYDAVYVPGGHGPMEDLAVDADSGALLTRAVGSGMPVAVVCHGPAALLAAVKGDGTNAFAGYRVAAFTNEEERIGGFADKAKWLLVDRLTEAGLRVESGAPWAPYTVTDRNVLTGQNPASSAPLAALLNEKLG